MMKTQHFEDIFLIDECLQFSVKQHGIFGPKNEIPCRLFHTSVIVSKIHGFAGHGRAFSNFMTFHDRVNRVLVVKIVLLTGNGLDMFPSKCLI